MQINNVGAQGDVLFVRMDDGDVIPSQAKEVTSGPTGVVVAHSETGHHHVAVGDLKVFQDPADPLVGFLAVGGEFAEIQHHRSFDTHASVHLPTGKWRIHRQREASPEGWQRVAD